jgi:serine/threonine-protein kinase RsbT
MQNRGSPSCAGSGKMATGLTESVGVVVPIASESDLIQVRHTLRQEAESAGFSLVDQTKLITAGSELARNVLVHSTGSRGVMRVEQASWGERAGVRVTFSDEGPGIADVDLALTDGFSTAGSLGLGLPGSKRLVDELMVTSSVGSGTTVVIVKWRR